MISKIKTHKVVLAIILLFVALFAQASSGPSYKSYVVAVDATAQTNEWTDVVKVLKDKHNAIVVKYNGKDDLSKVLRTLKTIRPKYVCFVGKPEAVGRDFVKAAYEMLRKIDSDPYGDAIWGIITGYSAEDALKIVKAPRTRKIRSIATSMGGPGTLENWSAGLASDERTPDNFWMKNFGGPNEKVVTGGNVSKAYAHGFNTIEVDYFSTSGHATERNWQIIFNKNCGLLKHTAEAGLFFEEPGGKVKHALTNAAVKAYIGAGNCLIGHVDNKACMATAWMRTAGVENFAGYTVPSWYGFMGWGVKKVFDEGRYSMAEARYLTNERLIWCQSKRHGGIEDRGLNYDRDTFAFYGDPAQIIKMPEDNTPYKVYVKGKRVEVVFTRDCKLSGMDKVRGASPIMTLLHREPYGDVLVTASGREIPDSVVTERFLILPLPGEHKAGERFVCYIGKKQ